MPKTLDEIKAEIESVVKSQGNQGALGIGNILDDIAELAAQGGGGGTELPYELVSITIGTGTYGYLDDMNAVSITADDAAKLKAALDAGKLCMVALNMNIDQSDSTDWPHMLPTPAFAQARKEFACPNGVGNVETYNYGIYLSGASILRDRSTNNCIFVAYNLHTTTPSLDTFEGYI